MTTMVGKAASLDPVEQARKVLAEMEAEWKEKLRIISERRRREREERERWFFTMFPPTGAVCAAW